jgi:phosphatidate cytidylyltransferase
MTEATRSQLLIVLAGVVAVLVFASTVSRVLQSHAGAGEPPPAISNLEARIRSWWVLVALLAGALMIGTAGVTVLFAIASTLALREFIAHAPPAVRDPPLDRACFALVWLQYAIVALGGATLVSVALPLAATIVLPLVALFTGGVRRLWSRSAPRLLWTALAGWCLSFVPALLLLDVGGYSGRNLLLVLYLIVVTQGSDVLQYVFGKLFGRRAIAPRISPDKTIEGFAGGIVSATAIGTALWWMTPFDPAQAACVALSSTLLGFAGGLLLSAIKRDLRIKDWGRSIKGHGGVLDRVDSLCLSAPALFWLAYLSRPA